MEDETTFDEQVDELAAAREQIAEDSLVGDDSEVGEAVLEEVPPADDTPLEDLRAEVEANSGVGDDSGVEAATLDYTPMVDGELTDEHKALDPDWVNNLRWLDDQIRNGADLEDLSAQTLLPLEQLEIRKENLLG